ncbi:hypothetical protein CBL_06300 [Carabus blaptoides fortunei]
MSESTSDSLSQSLAGISTFDLQTGTSSVSGSQVSAPRSTTPDSEFDFNVTESYGPFDGTTIAEDEINSFYFYKTVCRELDRFECMHSLRVVARVNVGGGT